MGAAAAIILHHRMIVGFGAKRAGYGQETIRRQREQRRQTSILAQCVDGSPVAPQHDGLQLRQARALQAAADSDASNCSPRNTPAA